MFSLATVAEDAGARSAAGAWWGRSGVTRARRPYVVRQGDHLDRLALELGFDRAAVWGDAANKDLRAVRPDPNLLAPGDVVQVPEAPRSSAPLRLGDANTYAAQVPEAPLRLRLDTLTRGRTLACRVEGALAPTPTEVAADGALSLRVSLLAREVTVTLPALGVRLAVCVGHLDPLAEPSGVAHRLANLGYASADTPATEAGRRAALAVAITRFQRDRGLPESGAADDETLARLRAECGC